MEWTALLKTNHHFLKQSLSADHDGRDDQSAPTTTPPPPLSVFRRSEPLDLSHDDGSAATGAGGGAVTARRTVSISRSGRYKSKTKQRVRLFNNGLDIAATPSPAVTTASPAAVAGPSIVPSSSDGRRRQTVVADVCSSATRCKDE